MSARTIAAGIAAAVLWAAPAAAAECTEAAAEAKSQELFEVVQADPAKAERLEAAIATVEAEYGGEPADDEVCAALEKVIEILNGE